MYTIWIGHGNIKGISIRENETKSWVDISREIETNTGLNVFLSCQSSNLKKFTKSVVTIGEGKIDAEVGAYLSVFVITGEPKYLKESIRRLAYIAMDEAKPKYLLLVNNGASSNQGSTNQNNHGDDNPFIVGNMSLLELYYHMITIAVTIVETVIFNRLIPEDLRETISDRIATLIFTNSIPTFIFGILGILPLIVAGDISFVDGMTAIIGYLFDFFGYLLTVVISWIDSKSNILERLFWLWVLGTSIASKITNPTGLLNIVLNAVPIIAALIAAALDYIDPDKDVGSTTF